MHPHTQTPSEIACRDRLYPEYTRLHALWTEWSKTLKDAPAEAEVERVPLALRRLVEGFLEELRATANQAHPNDLTAALTHFSSGLNELLFWMFRFGQYAASHPETPVLFEDLSYCNCHRLTEDDLAKLLESS